MNSRRVSWSSARPLTLPRIDHVGLVVPDVDPVVAEMRELGFRVSEPMPLEGSDGPIGQVSAHCIFADSYIEISAPIAGSGNHLEPLLENGPGWRLLVLRSDDCDADHRRLEKKGVACGPLQQAMRTVDLPDGPRPARFNWFEILGLVEGLLVAMVEHRDAEVVFDARLADHPNGAIGIEAVLFGAPSAALASLAENASDEGPRAMIGDGACPVAGLRLTGGHGLEFDAGGAIGSQHQSVR